MNDEFPGPRFEDEGLQSILVAVPDGPVNAIGREEMAMTFEELLFVKQFCSGWDGVHVCCHVLLRVRPWEHGASGNPWQINSRAAVCRRGFRSRRRP